MKFLERPLDLGALQIVLDTMARGPASPEAALLVSELEILVDEAQRAFDRSAWEDRIIARWKVLEKTIRSEDSVALAAASD